MRKVLMSFLSILSTLSYPILANSGGIHEDHPYDFIIAKDVYKFSEIYQIKSLQKETYPGSVKKSAFRIRTNYDLSNKDGWQATGITRILSLGSLYPWAKNIDIYDTNGKRIGLIDGNLATLESAKFTLYEYDETGEAIEVGVAYPSPSFERFVILSSPNNPHPIAECNRNVYDKNWAFSMHYPEKIDDRIIRIFAGFVIDNEDTFSKSP